jgi:hypothetical protein
LHLSSQVLRPRRSDTSNGGPLQAKIVTQESEAEPTALFWLLDETGDFCVNNAPSTLCYITLVQGLNDAPYSLAPLAVHSDDKQPAAMWAIDQVTGVLSASWEGKSPMTFTQNENDLCVPREHCRRPLTTSSGNGDIDSWLPTDTPDSSYTSVKLQLMH